MDQQQHLSRRDCLKTSLAGLCSLCLASCSQTTELPPEEYWRQNRQDLLHDFDATLPPVRNLIVEICGEQDATAILNESRKEYEAILPRVPFIGGEDNSLTEVLYMSAIALAFYHVMKAHGRSLDETGRVIYRAMEALTGFRDPLAGAQSRNPTGKMAQDEFRRMARQSQKSTYPEDWKLTFVEGNGKDFDFGVDYTECGIVKFYRAQKAEELAPYMCLGDFPISQSVDSGLVRTTTLARGGPRCDFRFKAGRPIQMEWTPDFLKKK